MSDTSVKVSRVRVWDLPTRLFHWLLVALVAIALVTGFVAPEWWMGLHSAAGYGVVVLIIFRLVWGFLGTEHSRFSSFLRAPRYLRGYLAGLLILRPPHFIGHNPLGVLMIFALGAWLIALTVTGMIVLGGEEKQGPFAGILSYASGDAAKFWHSLLAWVLVGFIGAHVLGVIGESLLSRENLARAMVTGWKRAHGNVKAPQGPSARPVTAAIITIGAVSAAVGAALYLSTLPPLGYRTLEPSAIYEKECGACHWAFHPSLLPAASWQRVTAGLSDHFGEDASLADNTQREIDSWLTHNASETWDTEAANRFRVIDPTNPTRITATPYWRAKHAEIEAAVFAGRAVRSRVNCLACHLDAATGRFDDQNITIPKEP